MSLLNVSCCKVLGSFVQSFSLCKGMLPAAKVFSNSHSYPKVVNDYFLCTCILWVLAGTWAMNSSDSGVSVGLEPQFLKGAFYMTVLETSSTRIPGLLSQLPKSSSYHLSLLYVNPYPTPRFVFLHYVIIWHFCPKTFCDFFSQNPKHLGIWCLSLPSLYYLLQTYLM